MNKKKCILCNQGKIKSFVNLGFSALANNLISLKDYKKKEKKYPLILGKCERCDHVQLRDLVSPNICLTIIFTFPQLHQHYRNI